MIFLTYKWLILAHSLTLFSGAVIGFEKLLYFVEESEGEVVVTVGVQSGTLSGEVVVRLSTNSDTATGECYYSFEIFTLLHFSLKFSPFSLPLFFLPLSSSSLSLLSFSLFFLPLLPPSLSQALLCTLVI